MRQRPAHVPRAVGVRGDYADIPDEVRAWVETTLGDAVVEARTQVGGMSPGCAARLRTRSGSRAFVKAVGAELNPGTPELFRREINVLRRLDHVPHRPRVLATYDDGHWVALLLEDVDGRYPNLDDPADARAVWSLVEQQSRELTPAPPGLGIRTLRDVAARAVARWALLLDSPVRYLPAWAARRARELHDRIQFLPARLPADSLCHWDVRDDNLLVRSDGTIVILDWGMACLGPHWADLFILSVAWADRPTFDDRMAAVPERPHHADVTDLLIVLGGSQAWLANQPAPPGLPRLPSFARREGARMLEGARRRLGVPG